MSSRTDKIDSTTSDFMKDYEKISKLSQEQTLKTAQMKLEMDLATGFASLAKSIGSDVKQLAQG